MNFLAPVFKALTQLRARLYCTGKFSSVELPIPVISIGNLTMGGTGKTPFALWLLAKYQEQLKIGVVVRSYKTQLQEPLRVGLENKSSETFGDEAVLIQRKLPKVIVYSGPSKFETAQKLYQNEKPDLLVVDDGFQHLKLKRNLDIVLLDTSVSISDYSWLPFGRLREDFSALKRAAIVVLTKTEMRNEKTYTFIKGQIPAAALVVESEQCMGNPIFVGGKVLNSVNFVESESFNPVNNLKDTNSIKDPKEANDIETNLEFIDINRSKDLKVGIIITSKEFNVGLERSSKELKVGLVNTSKAFLKTKKCFAFAGLARPENFRRSLEQLGLPIGNFLSLPDHVNYNSKLIQEILEQSKNFDYCITTEKDAVKLQDWPSSAPSLFVAPVEIKIKTGETQFFAKMDQILKRGEPNASI